MRTIFCFHTGICIELMFGKVVMKYKSHCQKLRDIRENVRASKINSLNICIYVIAQTM